MNEHHDEQSQMHRQHIFVVNGSPEFLDLVRELLQSEQFNVTTTNFVPDTFDQIEVLHPHLLIVDLAVGERAGWELIERMNSEASVNCIPTIVVSTNTRYLDIVREQPTRFGGQRLLHKPFDLDDLLCAVDELIGSA